MEKSVFKISQMDCPSEEQMIRMKLDGINEIKQLEFEIPQRKLTIFHIGNTTEIERILAELKLGSKLISNTQSQVVIDVESDPSNQRKILWAVLIINFVFFVLEMLFGLISKSMGLVADSLDMLADSIVYALSLMAVGQSAIRKKNVAKWSGYFQLLLALIGLVEVIRRFIGSEEMPVFQTMIVISILALIANGLSLYLIQKSKSKEAHMQASAIFTSNDIIINIGVIIAGTLVYFTSSQIPDLAIGSIVFLIVIRGAFRILKLAK
ncbi:cation transporter [Algoriphagus marincola]|jgi:Co/Zn/Cd efflux system component|uniref:Cation transporter n=1 Tax=Algoriphagus marincola TaxID=264027 RepID=A0ABS7N2Z0_9BACT|nr:cation transporter [Algoriphagus marincola]MBY5950273.1 cation transporter [Algoriphagus marincola]